MDPTGPVDCDKGFGVYRVSSQKSLMGMCVKDDLVNFKQVFLTTVW